jgi:hypothetical protein
MVCGTSVASAQSQVDLFPFKDASLFEPDSVDNPLAGGGGDLFVGRTGSQRLRRGMISFDVAGAVPSGSVITSVVIRLEMSQSNAGDADIRVHRILADWGEGTAVGQGGGGAGAPARLGDATWTHRFLGGEPWINEGGDFAPEVLTTLTVGGPGSYQFSSAGLASAVQDMLDHPEQNFGFMFIGPEQPSILSAKRFRSREFSTQSVRPKITIEYTPPCVADWNQDGGIDGDDVIAFFADWDASDADVDGSGGTDGDDVIVFFGAWDSNCT